LVVDVARFRGDDLAVDLADRDFTVNALAFDVRFPDAVIDYHGGLGDLERGVIRAVTAKSILNDPLRALRAVRQAAQLGFELAPETKDLIERDGRALAKVSGERIRDELARLLALPRAMPHLYQLDALGLLTIILPELAPLRSLSQPAPHCLDALSHSLETVGALESLLAVVGQADNSAQAAPHLGAEVPWADAWARITGLSELEPFAVRIQSHLAQVMSDHKPRLVIVKLAALLHDTGKASSQTVDTDGRIRFLGHQEEGTRIAEQALSRLRFSGAEVRLARSIVQNHMRPLLLANEKRVTARAVYRFFRDTGEAGVDVLLHALADHQATYGHGREENSWSRLVALTARMLEDFWEHPAERVTPAPLIDGYDLLHEFGLQPGPRIGRLLEAVREAQVSEQVTSRDEALAFVRTMLLQGE
jgi:tRNA nucleotidyltransferase/poly(A) polymerase